MSETRIGIRIFFKVVDLPYNSKRMSEVASTRCINAISKLAKVLTAKCLLLDLKDVSEGKGELFGNLCGVESHPKAHILRL